jgi:hypothetical protein
MVDDTQKDVARGTARPPARSRVAPYGVVMRPVGDPEALASLFVNRWLVTVHILRQNEVGDSYCVGGSARSSPLDDGQSTRLTIRRERL